MTKTPRLLVLADGYVRSIAPPADATTTQVSNWRFVAVKHTDGIVRRHLVGRVDNEGRVSTAVQSLNLQAMSAITDSGRVYEMIGVPSEDDDASYLYTKWLKYGGRAECKDLTRALVRLCRMRKS